MNRVVLLFLLLFSLSAFAQESVPENVEPENPARGISLEQAIRIALDENASVRIADLEIKRTGYARKGSYATLFPQIDGSGSYQRTIKKQVMYIDMPGMEAGGIEVGRYNTWSAGITASMPLINAQLWKSLKISSEDVELAVEKARGSRLETVKQVKQAYYTVLLAKELFQVYRQVYENALYNYRQIEQRYNVQKASELDLTRAKTTLASAIPNVYDSENAVMLALWQLKAVMGVDLKSEFDTTGSLLDYTEGMMQDAHWESDPLSLEHNSTLRQLAIQAEQLADAVKMQSYAYLPSLSLMFSYAVNAMDNTFDFQNYKWSPYSYVGFSLNIPIFSGGKRLNNVRAAKVQAAELDIQRENTEKQLHIAIRQCINTMETATKSYASAQSAVESAQKAYDISQKSYDVGRSTLTDLNDAQLALTQSQLSICQAIHNYIVAKAELESTLGADFIDKNKTE